MINTDISGTTELEDPLIIKRMYYFGEQEDHRSGARTDVEARLRETELEHKTSQTILRFTRLEREDHNGEETTFVS